jgi:hypothetical protein
LGGIQHILTNDPADLMTDKRDSAIVVLAAGIDVERLADVVKKLREIAFAEQA